MTTEQDVERVARAIDAVAKEDGFRGTIIYDSQAFAKAAIAAMPTTRNEPKTFEATCLCGHTLTMTEGVNKHEKAVKVLREARHVINKLASYHYPADPQAAEYLPEILRRIDATVDEIVGE